MDEAVTEFDLTPECGGPDFHPLSSRRTFSDEMNVTTVPSAYVYPDRKHGSQSPPSSPLAPRRRLRHASPSVSDHDDDDDDDGEDENRNDSDFEDDVDADHVPPPRLQIDVVNGALLARYVARVPPKQTTNASESKYGYCLYWLNGSGVWLTPNSIVWTEYTLDENPRPERKRAASAKSGRLQIDRFEIDEESQVCIAGRWLYEYADLLQVTQDPVYLEEHAFDREDLAISDHRVRVRITQITKVDTMPLNKIQFFWRTHEQELEYLDVSASHRKRPSARPRIGTGTHTSALDSDDEPGSVSSTRRKRCALEESESDEEGERGGTLGAEEREFRDFLAAAPAHIWSTTFGRRAWPFVNAMMHFGGEAAHEGNQFVRKVLFRPDSRYPSGTSVSSTVSCTPTSAQTCCFLCRKHKWTTTVIKTEGVAEARVGSTCWKRLQCLQNLLSAVHEAHSKFQSSSILDVAFVRMSLQKVRRYMTLETADRCKDGDGG